MYNFDYDTKKIEYWLQCLSSYDQDKKDWAESYPPKYYDPKISDLPDDRFLCLANRNWKSKLFTELNGVFNRRISINMVDEKISRFIRDAAVTLFPSGFLIPYPIQDPILKNHLLAILPTSADAFIINETERKIYNASCYGRGFQKSNGLGIRQLAFRQNIPFQQAKTCIEGGNCFLFVSHGKKKALVGEISLFLSMIALEEQGAFQELEPDTTIEPSLDAIRIARNLELYAIKRVEDYSHYLQNLQIESTIQEAPPSPGTSDTFVVDDFAQKDFVSSQEDIEYRRALVAPVTDEEKTQYKEIAKMVETKILFTQYSIARELKLDFDDVIFVPQTSFHIDMEVAVAPNGRLLLHDPELVESFLNSIDKLETSSLCQEYVQAAQKDIQTHRHTYQKRKEILERHNVDFINMPAIFKASKTTLNHCNGIFVQEGDEVLVITPNKQRCYGRILKDTTFFITTGPSGDKQEEIVHRRFSELFKQHFPESTCIGIEGMSPFLHSYHGGIRCLTLNASPSPFTKTK